MIKKAEILEFLKKDEVRNINVINFIESYEIHCLEKVGNSVLVKGTSDRPWVYISSENKEELKQIKNKLEDRDKNFAIIEDWMIPILTDDKKLKWKLSTIKLILPKAKEVDNPKNLVSELMIKDAEFIYENSDYKDFLSLDYVAERIENGISSCVKFKDKPVAWAITQDDGAIGFLHVVPEYRKQGFAKAVTLDMIRKVREKNKLPFVHVEESNEKSMNLSLNMGFEKDRVISWFELE